MAFKITAYIINLDGSDERWKSATAELNKLNLCHVRVSAIDGRNRPLSDFPSYDSAKTRRHYDRDLNGGEIGCYLSHIRALNMFIESGADSCLILEDDFVFSAVSNQDGTRVFNEVQDLLANGWALCNVGSSYDKRNRAVRRVDQVVISQSYIFPLLTHAIIWSRNAALDFIAQHSQIAEPVDHAFRSWATRQGRALMITPPLFTQILGNSDINKSTTSRKGDEGNRLLAKMRRRKISLSIKAPLYFWATYHQLRAIFFGKHRL
jgi:glycosyl transferase family 25